MRRIWTVALTTIMLLLPACFSLENSSNSAEATPTAAVDDAAATPVAPSTPLPGAGIVTDTITADQAFIVWVPPEISVPSATGNSFLQEQLALAMADYPAYALRIEQKAISGQGGILSYLRAGRNVAPEILPDLIILRADQLETAVADNLIQPVSGLVDPALVNDLHPAARALVELDETLVAYPFALTGLSHLAYHNQLITGTVPATWSEFSALPDQRFVFPAAGRDGATYGLQLYLSAGGTLQNEAGQPELQLEPLLSTLEQLGLARQSEFIIPQSNNLTTLAESWQLFQSGAASAVQTTTDQLLAAGVVDQNIAVAPLPGNGARVTPYVDGWVWAISASDQAKQTIAANLISFMSAESRLTEWAKQTGLLPAQQAALQLWAQENSYVLFIQEELELARPFPKQATSTMLNVFGNAVFDVISLTKSPQVAADEAIDALQQ